MTTSLSRRDAVLLILLTLVWGINWPVMKIGIIDVAPLTFRSVTMVGGLAVFALIARWQGHSLAIAREHWRETAVLSLTNLVSWYALSIIGVNLLSSGRAAILAFTLPVWVALIGVLFYREAIPGRRLLLALLAAATGVALLLANEVAMLTGSPLGTLILLLAAAIWGLGTHQLRRRRQQTPIVVLSFWMMAAAFVVCTVLAFLFERERWGAWPSLPAWASIVYNIVLAYGVAQLLWFRLATILPPVVSALSVMMIPVIGVLSGWAMLGERPQWTDLVALIAILIAIAATLMPSRQAPTPARSD